MGGNAVMSVKRIEEWNEDTTLGDAGVEDDGGGCAMCDPN